MTNFLNKINQFRYKKIIVISIVVLYTLCFAGCYTSHDFIIEGSQLKDTASYDEINYVRLKDSIVIKFKDKEHGYGANYLKIYENNNDVILYVSKIDTATINQQIYNVKKYDFVDVKTILKAKVSKEKFDGGPTVGIIAGVVLALVSLFTIGLGINGF